MFKTVYDQSLEFVGNFFITYKIKITALCYSDSNRQKTKTLVFTVTSDYKEFAIAEACQNALDTIYQTYFDAEILSAEILDHWRV